MDLTSRIHHCGSERQYSAEYDAYYCELCNEWLEEKCSDEDCDFCSKRPDKPSQIQLTNTL